MHCKLWQSRHSGTVMLVRGGPALGGVSSTFPTLPLRAPSGEPLGVPLRPTTGDESGEPLGDPFPLLSIPESCSRLPEGEMRSRGAP